MAQQKYDETIDCGSCELKIPMTYCVNDKQYYHQAPGLSLRSCGKLKYK